MEHTSNYGASQPSGSRTGSSPNGAWQDESRPILKNTRLSVQ